MKTVVAIFFCMTYWSALASEGTECIDDLTSQEMSQYMCNFINRTGLFLPEGLSGKEVEEYREEIEKSKRRILQDLECDSVPQVTGEERCFRVYGENSFGYKFIYPIPEAKDLRRVLLCHDSRINSGDFDEFTKQQIDIYCSDNEENPLPELPDAYQNREIFEPSVPVS